MTTPPTEVERAVVDAAEARDASLSDADRRSRGVVHTPVEVARFVSRRLDEALRRLGRRGIADPDVALVDLACGPGIFLAAALAEAAPGAPRVALGLELDPRVAATAEETLRPAAAAAGWPLRVVAADTLAAPIPLSASEQQGATLAVIGNPPWASKSANRDAAYADGLLDDFRREADGAPLDERKVGVLSDDYVRFWRWACEAARGADGGAVVALVTNASFLDGPVHRGMRRALLEWFDGVDVFDLGGSALVARRGDRDDNVFGVRPAAAITVAFRAAERAHQQGRDEPPRVRHASLRGTRRSKLAALDRDDVSLIAVRPEPPALRFTPAPRSEPRYDRWPSLPTLVPFHREGLQTNRDAFCVDADRRALVDRLRGFAADLPGPWPGRADRPSGHYDPEAARAAARHALEARGDGAVRPIAYRPLDDRWVAAIPRLCHRPRPDLLRAIDASEMALLTVRKDRGEQPWAHFGATRHAVDNCYLSTRSSCRTRAFPTHRPDGEPNLDEAAVRRWAPSLAAPPSPRELLRYVLCVLAAPCYRRRFDAHLKADYPRIPPPGSSAAFDACVRVGAALEEAFADVPGGDNLGPFEPVAAGHSVEAGSDTLAVGHHRLAGPRADAVRRGIEACDVATQRLLATEDGRAD